MNTQLVRSVLFLSLMLWCHCSHASDSNLNRMVGLILSNGFVFGEIESIEKLPIGNESADFLVSVSSGNGVRHFLLNNPAHESLPVPHGGKKLILLSDGYARLDGSAQIQWSPSIGVYDFDEKDESAIDQEILAAKKDAASFLNENMDCPRKFEKLLSGLDGSRQQQSIDKLFDSLPLGSAEFACVIRAIESSSELTVGSFRPPYASREGIYHHGLRSRGELVLMLLPHLVNYSIYPSSSTLSEALRSKMIEAWAFWGSQIYAEK